MAEVAAIAGRYRSGVAAKCQRARGHGLSIWEKEEAMIQAVDSGGPSSKAKG